MTDHAGSRSHPPHGSRWWVLGAWASLALLAAGGLAGAAGVG